MITSLQIYLGKSDPISNKIRELFVEYNKGPRPHTNLNLSAFNKYLKGETHPHRNIQLISDGYPLHLILSQKPQNVINSKRELIKIIDHFIAELKSGAVVPTTQPPKYNINVFCVPKKDSQTGEKTKLRVVRHGSYADKNSTSINEWINKNKCKMPTLPNLHDYVEHLIDAEWMSLRDLKDAFRQIGLASKDIGYLGYSLFGLKMLDLKQPYGISSAAANCQSFGDLIIWILDNKKVPNELKHRILLHIDDFLMATKTKQQIIRLHQLFDQLCAELGVAISHEKNVDATQVAVVYGFKFDLKNKTVSIPDKKLKKLRAFIKSTVDVGIITGRALDTLCGKIMHWSQLFQPAKALCYNMISYLYKGIRQRPDIKKNVLFSHHALYKILISG